MARPGLVDLITWRHARSAPRPEPEPEPAPASEPSPPADGTGRRHRARAVVCAEANRPLSFDRVVELLGNRVTRAQVSAASAALCRVGELDREGRCGKDMVKWPARAAVSWPYAQVNSTGPYVGLRTHDPPVVPARLICTSDGRARDTCAPPHGQFPRRNISTTTRLLAPFSRIRSSIRANATLPR
jgi:hypothetical protein